MVEGGGFIGSRISLETRKLDFQNSNQRKEVKNLILQITKVVQLG